MPSSDPPARICYHVHTGISACAGNAYARAKGQDGGISRDNSLPRVRTFSCDAFDGIRGGLKPGRTRWMTGGTQRSYASERENTNKQPHANTGARDGPLRRARKYGETISTSSAPL